MSPWKTKQSIVSLGNHVISVVQKVFGSQFYFQLFGQVAHLSDLPNRLLSLLLATYTVFWQRYRSTLQLQEHYKLSRDIVSISSICVWNIIYLLFQSIIWISRFQRMDRVPAAGMPQCAAQTIIIEMNAKVRRRNLFRLNRCSQISIVKSWLPSQWRIVGQLHISIVAYVTLKSTHSLFLFFSPNGWQISFSNGTGLL